MLTKRKTLGQVGTEISRCNKVSSMICQTIRERLPESYGNKPDEFIRKYSGIYMQILIMICNMGYELYETFEDFKLKQNE